MSEITFNVTLKAEVPCLSTNQQDKVVDKVNTTIATNKGDQTFVRNIKLNPIVAIDRINSTLNSSKINER